MYIYRGKTDENLAPSNDDIDFSYQIGLDLKKMSSQAQGEIDHRGVFPLSLRREPPFFIATYGYQPHSIHLPLSKFKTRPNSSLRLLKQTIVFQTHWRQSVCKQQVPSSINTLPFKKNVSLIFSKNDFVQTKLAC